MYYQGMWLQPFLTQCKLHYMKSSLVLVDSTVALYVSKNLAGSHNFL